MGQHAGFLFSSLSEMPTDIVHFVDNGNLIVPIPLELAISARTLLKDMEDTGDYSFTSNKSNLLVSFFIATGLSDFMFYYMLEHGEMLADCIEFAVINSVIVKNSIFDEYADHPNPDYPGNKPEVLLGLDLNKLHLGNYWSYEGSVKRYNMI
ncbi:hypothetical protein [uncultured Flavobacterium sp.]|uniref:hypothetical protein n=1 Tax=uncultured Flavobacterium sp. TaxID=165435 RepID=UPI0025CD131A|nr:hypothetical protein [uncultured Flavobacterium sp.]